jgi:hypothetical protein
MNKKLLTETYYAGTIYGDMEYNALIEMLDKAKKDVELLYPEVLTNGHPMRVEFENNADYGDLNVNIIYHRHETEYEYELRREKELKAKAANTMELRKKIDANMEETITYLKSIGAI